MELRELRYFLAVAREQNITRAAESLFLSQPSLSKQMQNLEKEIGRPLFVRGSRKIVLTEAGMLLKKRAEEMLELYEKTESELTAPPEAVSGEISVGCGESRAVQTVADVAAGLRKQHPGLSFSFYSGDASFVTERLDKGLLDFGILVDHPDLSRYHALRLPRSDVWGVLMRRDSPLAQKEAVTPGDLKDLPLICSHQSLRGDSRLSAWFGGQTETLRLAGKYNLLYTGSLLVQAGMGYAVSLDGLINTEGTDLCFRPLFPQVETFLDLVWKKYQVFSRPAQTFLDAMLAYCGG